MTESTAYVAADAHAVRVLVAGLIFCNKWCAVPRTLLSRSLPTVRPRCLKVFALPGRNQVYAAVSIRLHHENESTLKPRVKQHVGYRLVANAREPSQAMLLLKELQRITHMLRQPRTRKQFFSCLPVEARHQSKQAVLTLLCHTKRSQKPKPGPGAFGLLT